MLVEWKCGEGQGENGCGVMGGRVIKSKSIQEKSGIACFSNVLTGRRLFIGYYGGTLIYRVLDGRYA